jgi:hypothetical protein
MATVDVESVSSGEPETTDTKTKATPQTKSVSSGVDIKKLLEAGAHFGHKTSRLNITSWKFSACRKKSTK